jgi:hypothetical protein
MSNTRLFLTTLLVTLCTACGATATASAASPIPVWLMNGAPLAAAHRASFTWSIPLVFKWKIGTESVEIRCTQAKSTETLEPRAPGTSKVEAFTFQSCTGTLPAGCNAMFPTAVLPWRTVLENDSGTIYQVFTMDAEVTFTGCTGPFNGTYLIKGPVKARMNNTMAGTVAFKFPAEILEGDDLETEGNPVEFSSEGEVALEEGGTLEVTNVSAFTSLSTLCEGGSLIVFCSAEGTSSTLFELEGEEEFEILSPSSFTLLSTIGESHLSMSCTATEAKHEGLENGLILQQTPLGAGGSNYLLNAVLDFTGCKLIEPDTTKCEVPSSASWLSTVGEPSSAEDIVFKPESGTIFAELAIKSISGQTCPATIVGTHKVTGSQLCLFVGAGSALEAHLLECNTLSGLKLGESAAELTFDSSILPVYLGEDWAVVEVG